MFTAIVIHGKSRLAVLTRASQDEAIGSAQGVIRASLGDERAGFATKRHGGFALTWPTGDLGFIAHIRPT